MSLIVSLACVGAAAAEQPQAAGRTLIVPAGWEGAYDKYHYSPAVRVGNMVIVSGVVAVGAETYEGKIRNMFEDVKQTLAAAGADMTDIVELTTFHQNVKDTETFEKEFEEFQKVHQEYFKAGYPAWTAVGTTALLAKGAPVEMRVVAIIGSGKGTRVQRAPKP
jgi:enamine deaminase RidA (YjgF/YER057c/UK114 family)